MSKQTDESNTELQNAPATKTENLHWVAGPWLGKLGACLVSFACGIAVNDFSGASGFPGLAGALALCGVVVAAARIRRLNPRARLPQYSPWLFITSAACLAAIAAFSSGSTVVILMIMAAALTVGAVFMVNDLLSVAMLLQGVAFVAVGAAVFSFGSEALANRHALTGSASIALGISLVASGAAAMADRDRLVEAAANLRFLACIQFGIAFATDHSPRVGGTMDAGTRPVMFGAAIVLTAAAIAWRAAVIARRRKLAAGALAAFGAGFNAFGAAFLASHATLAGTASMALGAATIAMSVAIIGPRTIAARVRQVVDWATKAPEEAEGPPKTRPAG